MVGVRLIVFFRVQLASVRIPIKRCRRLVGRGRGKVNVALNGRVGRRVACLLDDKGTTLECFDLEGDGEDGEGEEDAEAETVGGER
jgi:anaphase-promoting complex subunit 4